MTKRYPFRKLRSPCRPNRGPGLTKLEPKRTVAAASRPGESVYRSRKWKQLSAKLRRNGRCADCGAREELTVDHVIGLAAMGARPERDPRAWDPRNLVVRCRSCHSKLENTRRADHGNASFSYHLASRLDWLLEPDTGPDQAGGGGAE